MTGAGDPQTLDANGVLASVFDKTNRALRINGTGSSGAPTDASYLTGVAESGLSAEHVFGATVFYPPDVVANRPAASATIVGALFYATDTQILYRSDGATTWTSVSSGAAGALLAANNLSDVVSAATSLANIGGIGAATTNTLTNKRVTRRVTALSSNSATPTINTDNCDTVHITGQSVNITSFTTNLSGTPVDGDMLHISITDAGSPVTLSWGTSFSASTVALPTTTVASTRLDVGFVWSTGTSKWRCVAVA